MGTIVLIALYGGYLMLFVGLVGLWLLRPVRRRSTDAVPRSLLETTEPVSMTGGKKPPASRQGSAEQPLERPSLQCSFCGKTQVQVAKLIAGPSVYICDECVGHCIAIMGEALPQACDDRPRPRDVSAVMDQAIDGHRHAKSVLATAGWRQAGYCPGRRCDDRELRFDTLLVGGTAAARRRLANALADAFEVPFIALDAVEVLAAGERMAALKAIYSAVFEPYWNCYALPRCVLFVENLDRIGAWPVAGSFQRALVGIVDGRRSPAWDLMDAPVHDSSQVHLICAGDFEGLGRAEGHRDGDRSGGFGRFGICQLLVDRLPCVAMLDPVGQHSNPTGSRP